MQDDQLGNLGFRVEYVRSLWDIAREPGYALTLGVAPYARWFSTRAAPTDHSPLPQGVGVLETGLGAEAVGLLRWAVSPS